MPKYLKDAVKYSNKRISADEITLENYVTTDNLLQNKQGKTKVESLPPNGGNVTAYEEGDILISNIRPYLKKLWFANQSGGSSADVLTFKVKQGFEPKFIYYSVFRDLFFDHMMNGSKGTKMPRGDKNQILDFPIPNFPLSTQKSIAKVLSDLDAKIELNNKINRELEAMAKTLYDYWFVQFDFPNADGKPYKSSGGKMVYNAELKREIPEGWAVKTLSKITAVSNESINPLLTPEKDFKHYSIPTFDIKKTYWVEKGIEIRSNKFTVAETDLLVSKLNPWFSRVIYPIKEDDLICSTEFVVWRTSDKTIKNFLFMVATGEHFIAHCTQSATGTSNSHKRVNPTVMMRHKIPYNADLIQKYGSTIDPLLKNIVSKRIENQHLTALRDWLLPMLMNGQVTVRQAHGKLETEERLNMAAEPSVKYGN